MVKYPNRILSEKSSPVDVEQIITDAANKYGIDPNYAIEIARCRKKKEKSF